MSNATANRTDLLIIAESTWGTTPTSPAMQQMRYTGEQLSKELSFEKSKEIRSDRMLSDTILVDASPSGSYNLEFSSGTFDVQLAAALMSAWGSALAIVGSAGDISSDATGFTSTTSGKFTNIQVGQWIKVSGFATAGNNGYFYVSAKADNQTITTLPAPAGAQTPTGTNAHIDGSMLRNGTTEQSFTVIKRFNDTTATTYEIFKGQRIKGFTLDMQTGSILTGTMSMVGKSSEYTETAPSGMTVVATTSTDVLNCVNDVQNILQDNAAMGAVGSVMSISFELDNQHREQKGIGVLGNTGVVAGQLMVNVTASQYFADLDQADKVNNVTPFSFSVRLEDAAGNAYIITIQKAKYEAFSTQASGLDSDVMAETQFTALRDPTTNCMVQIDRFPVA